MTFSSVLSHPAASVFNTVNNNKLHHPAYVVLVHCNIVSIPKLLPYMNKLFILAIQSVTVIQLFHC